MIRVYCRELKILCLIYPRRTYTRAFTISEVLIFRVPSDITVVQNAPNPYIIKAPMFCRSASRGSFKKHGATDHAAQTALS